MSKTYTKEQIWTVVKAFFNPTAEIYELNGEIFPVSNTEEQEKEIKKTFFDAFDEILSTDSKHSQIEILIGNKKK